MRTEKLNPANFEGKLRYVFLLLAFLLSVNLLTGCEPEEEIEPRPTESASISNDLVRNFENLTVYRMELRITTANVEDADTDDGVYVQVNGRDRNFYLSKAIDDFERNRTYTYDILSGEVKTVRDITQLKLGLRGDDAISFKRLELFLNGNKYPVFVKEFAGSGRWLDNSQSFTIPGYELRRHAGWRFTPQHNNMDKPPVRLSQQMIVSLVESSIGDQMNHMSGLGWGDKTWGLPNSLFGPPVEITYVDSKTLHFDLDLKINKRYLPDPALDVDFDLIFTCNNGIINTRMENLKFETNWVGDLYLWLKGNVVTLAGTAIGSYVGSPAAGTAAGALMARFLSFDFKLTLQDPNISSSCQKIQVTPGGDIVLRAGTIHGAPLALE
jgi:hypothetical protein